MGEKVLAIIEKVIEKKEFWALVGVFVGFLLAEVARFLRYRCRIHKLRSILREELKNIPAQIEQKKDIIRQAIDQLKNRSVLPTSSVRVLQTGYIENISELYTHLSERERNCLHVIYERIRIADDLLDNFESKFLTIVQEGIITDPYQFYFARFSDTLKSYDIVQELIKSYLAGNPEDVFSKKWTSP